MHTLTNQSTYSLSKGIKNCREKYLLSHSLRVKDPLTVIQSVLFCTVNPYIEEKEIYGQSLTVKGFCEIDVLFKDMNGEISSVSESVSFAVNNELPEWEDISVYPVCSIESLDYEILKGKRIDIKSEIAVDICIAQSEECKYISDIREVEDLEKLGEDEKCTRLFTEKGEKEFPLRFPIEGKTPGDIVYTSVKLDSKSQNADSSGIMFSAKCRVDVLYTVEEEDGTFSYRLLQQSTPVSYFLEMNALKSYDLYVSDSCIKKGECYFLYDNDDLSVALEVSLSLVCLFSKTETIRFVRDMYAPSKNIALHTTQMPVIGSVESVSSIINCKNSMNISQITDSENIACTRETVHYNTAVTGEGTVLCGKVFCEILFIESGNTFTGASLQVPFRLVLSSSLETQTDAIAFCRIASVSYEVKNSEVSVDLNLQADGLFFTRTETSYIDGYEIEDRNKDKQEYKSIKIHYHCAGESLREIAKVNGIGLKEIRDKNGIQTQEDFENMGYICIE